MMRAHNDEQITQHRGEAHDCNWSELRWNGADRKLFESHT